MAEVALIISGSDGLETDNPIIQSEFLRAFISPNYPDKYPNNVYKEWHQDIPDNTQGLLLIDALDIERAMDSLIVSYVSAHGTNHTLFSLASSNVTSLILPPGNITVTFCTDSVGGKSGFVLNLRTVSSVERCVNGSYLCEATNICLAKSLRCDGVEDCPLADDEAQCASEFCPLGCQCGESAFNDRHGPPSPVCDGSVQDWLPFWVNCSNAWTRDHARNASKKTAILNLKDSQIEMLDVGSFQELVYTSILDLTNNRLTYIQAGVFDGLDRLKKIVLDYNQLLRLEGGAFRGLRELQLLYLDFNNLTTPGLEDGCFTDLENLWFISIGFQAKGLTSLKPGTFQDMKSLQRLILVNNQIESINSSLLTGATDHLQILNMKSNPLIHIEPGTFAHANQLTDLYMDDPRLCCIIPSTVSCRYTKPYHPLFTCRKTFLQNGTIQVFMWIIGISALIGNTIAIIQRLGVKHSSEVAAVQSTLIKNLAAADLLMGAYMILMAVMNQYIGESYFWEARAEEWRASTPCQVAGFLAMVSSEASVFIITIMSVDRFINIFAPFSGFRLQTRTTIRVMAATWSFAIMLGAVSLVLNYISPDAYSLSDVCVGLPLIRKDTAIQVSLDANTQSQYGITGFNTIASNSVSTWQFSIAVFLGVNLFSFIIITISYIAIFFKVRYSRANAGRQAPTGAETKMAAKMSLIVGTDLCCWMPIIILGILVQAAGVNITPDVYAWLVAFVLPINSSLNPYIYTLIGNK